MLYFLAYLILGMIVSCLVYLKEDRSKLKIVFEFFSVVLFFPIVLLNPILIILQKRKKK